MRSSRTAYLWMGDTLYTGQYQGRYLDILVTRDGRPAERIYSGRLTDLDVTDPDAGAVLARHLPMEAMPPLLHHGRAPVRRAARGRLAGKGPGHIR